MLTSRKQTSSYQDKVIKELEAAPNAKYREWTEFDLDVIRKYYGKKDIRAIAKILNKSIGAVYRKASYIGVSYYKERNHA